MNDKLKNKAVLVTGGASGIGAALCLTFARAGAMVWVADIDEAGGQAVAREIGGRFVALDVASESACTDAARTVGQLDVLANVAGIAHVGTLLNTSAEDCDRLHGVNVRGVFNCCKAFASGMLDRGTGSIINMACVAGIVAVRDRLAYTMTKFAVVGLTKALALDHSHTGVRFNCICPGRVETPPVLARMKQFLDPGQASQEMASAQINGRMIQAEEVAAAALYLAADESAMITGSTLMIDGVWSIEK